MTSSDVSAAQTATAAQYNNLRQDVSESSPPGKVAPFACLTAPAGWLLADGSAVSRATYADLFSALTLSLGTFTITIAVPGVVTLTAHGMQTGDAVYFTTTGALPTGLSVNTRYWIIRTGANTFTLASSLANAIAGTAITTTGTQSGVHTCTRCPYGVGDGSTTFNLPDYQGKILVGLNTADGGGTYGFAAMGQTGGAKTHTLTTPEMPAHTHNALDGFSGGGGSGTYAGANRVSNTVATSSTGGGGSHNNVQPYAVGIMCIKT